MHVNIFVRVFLCVQVSFLVLGCAQLYTGFVMLPDSLMTVPSAKCAVASVIPHSLRNGQPVSAGINTTDWEFGLLLGKCTVPAGHMWVKGEARVRAFAEPVEFNGFYLLSRSAQPELDPSSFTLECLSPDGGSGHTSVTLAGKGVGVI